MTKEIEIKLSVPSPGVLSEIRKDFDGRFPCVLLHSRTEYYDISALGHPDWMLRRRYYDSRETVFTFKGPAEGYSRTEVECTAASPSEAVTQLCALGAPEALLCLNMFSVFCGAEFDRVLYLFSENDCSAEICFDTGCLTGGGMSEPLCELELEWKSGDFRSLEALRDRLIQIYSLEELHISKYARARALALGGNI